MTETIRYLRVPCHILQVTCDAVRIDVTQPHGPVMHWIPLSLLHTLDERTVSSKVGDVITLRIVDWKVRALNLPTEK